MAKRKIFETAEDAIDIETPEDAGNIKVQFNKVALGSYGSFYPGSIVELPIGLARSFIAEGAAEEVV